MLGLQINYKLHVVFQWDTAAAAVEVAVAVV